jgi:hypothetical protein
MRFAKTRSYISSRYKKHLRSAQPLRARETAGALPASLTMLAVPNMSPAKSFAFSLALVLTLNSLGQLAIR